MRLLALLVFVAVVSCAPLASSENEEALAGALRLKQEYVERFWEGCLPKGSEERCREILQLTWEREKRVLKRIEQHQYGANTDRILREMTACYSLNSTYIHLVDCWESLADRLYWDER